MPVDDNIVRERQRERENKENYTSPQSEGTLLPMSAYIHHQNTVYIGLTLRERERERRVTPVLWGAVVE